MWAAFTGYQAIYGRLPPARLVRRVRLYLVSKNHFEVEEQERLHEEIERAHRGGGAR